MVGLTVIMNNLYLYIFGVVRSHRNDQDDTEFMKPAAKEVFMLSLL